MDCLQQDCQIHFSQCAASVTSHSDEENWRPLKTMFLPSSSFLSPPPSRSVSLSLSHYFDSCSLALRPSQSPTFLNRPTPLEGSCHYLREGKAHLMTQHKQWLFHPNKRRHSTSLLSHSLFSYHLLLFFPPCLHLTHPTQQFLHLQTICLLSVLVLFYSFMHMSKPFH